ncbi:MAG: VPLPA-CTERM sorting domain-containing protein, partial [Candidatus Thiodiazotropha sp.]
FIQITSSLDIDLWSVGLYVSGMEVASNAIGNQTLVISNLRLSNIVPVPIPAAAWLFVSGLLGLFGFNRRKSKT